MPIFLILFYFLSSCSALFAMVELGEERSDLRQEHGAEQTAIEEQRGRARSEGSDTECAKDKNVVDLNKGNEDFGDKPITAMDATSSNLPPDRNVTDLAGEGEPSEQPSLSGSFNGSSIQQVSPREEAMKSPTSFLDLLATQGVQEHILSFFFQDPLASQKKILTQGEEVLKKLKEACPDLPETIKDWSNLSAEQQDQLETKLPPGSLERVKGVAIASTILEAASKLQTAAILDASNAEPLATKKPYFLVAPLRVGANAANRNIEEIESAVSSILKLSAHKENCLSKTLQGSRENMLGQFQNAAITAEEAIQKFKKSAQIKTGLMNEGNPNEALQCHREGLILKNNALQQEATAFEVEYRECLAQATANGTPESLKQARELQRAVHSAFCAARFLDEAASARTAGNEKDAQASEQSAEYILQAAQAYAIGTPESLEQAKNLFYAANSASNAAGDLNKAASARTAGNEKEAQAWAQSAEYSLQEAQAYAIGTPESLEQAKNLRDAANSASNAAGDLNKAASARTAGNEKEAQAWAQRAEYSLQEAQAYAIGTPESLEKIENLKNAVNLACGAAEDFNKAASARTAGNEKEAQAWDQGVEYCLQEAQAYAIGTPESLKQAENLRHAVCLASDAAAEFNRAASVRTAGNEKQVQAWEQHAGYWLQLAQAYAIGTPESLEKIENLAYAAYWTGIAADEIKKYEDKADEANEAVQAEGCREAAAFILDKLEKFGWIPENREERFKKIFSDAEKIANPPQDGCVVM